MTPELTVLVIAALLQFVQIVVAGAVMNRDVGPAYNAGPRDEKVEFSPLTGRLRRAVDNHFEALALFTIAAVALALTGKGSSVTAACAWIYLAARIIYVPAYAYGWSPWRSVIFGVGATATLVMLLTALF